MGLGVSRRYSGDAPFQREREREREKERERKRERVLIYALRKKRNTMSMLEEVRVDRIVFKTLQGTQCRIPLKAKKATALGPAPQGARGALIDPLKREKNQGTS